MNSFYSTFRYHHCTLTKYMKGFNVGRDEQSFNLLSKMLTMDPKKRISTDEAMCHEYFTDPPNPSFDVFSCFEKIPFPHRKYLAQKIEPPKTALNLQRPRITRKTHLQERNI